MTVEELVKSVLGDESEPFDYEVAGDRLVGWRLYLLEDGDGRTDSASELVEASWRRLHDHGVQLFVGPSVFRIGPGEYADSWGAVEFDPADGPPLLPDPGPFPPTCSQVFALPGTNVLDIVEFCKVGSRSRGTRPRRANGPSASGPAGLRSRDDRIHYVGGKVPNVVGLAVCGVASDNVGDFGWGN